ncbi:WD40/YVTN/BNR-like repeat-containing protein [Acetivibrio cellulolyticus]|uniref:WD40/YVTN/BNR-like repeat-containing protein n=1 Tax=Acetivibrio cellulolyticus TaxID=35830 RepID=UPI0001E2F5C4|nr:YCF48-related protein [Acetivibrio cellulolyticus]
MPLIKALFSVIIIYTLLLTGCSVNEAPTKPTDKIANPVPSDSSTISSETESPWEIAFKSTFDESTFTLAGFEDDSTGILMGHHGAIHYTKDGGKTWSKAANEAHHVIGLDFVDDKSVYCCGDQGTIRYSNDAGASWTKLPEYDPLDQDPYIFTSFVNHKSGWVASTSKLGSTSDGGNTWTTLKLPESCKKIASINLSTESIGYILDTSGNLYITNDSGINWTQKSLNLKDTEKINGLAAAQVAVIRFADENNGLAIFYNKDGQLKALRTADGGNSWKNEAMPEMKSGYIYLNRNLQTLTIANSLDGEITVLKHTVK